MKKILCNTLIIIIMLGVFCNGYFSFSGLSFSDRVSYAEADNWSSCDSSDLVTAFRYYCKSRNLAIEGSVVDSLTSFTTTTFNNLCSTLGIDPTQLQAELKKTTSGNLGLRFLFSQTGITAYNRIFAEFLQNNDLSVGDEVDNKVLDTYKYYTDNNGNKCVIYIVDSSSGGGAYPFTHILQKGTLLQSGEYFYNLFNGGSTTFTYDGYVYNIRNNSSYVDYPTIQISKNTYIAVYGFYNAISGHYQYYDCGTSIFQYNGDLYYGAVNYYTRSNDNTNFYAYRTFNVLNDDNGTKEDGDTYLTTNNNIINNNVYNNNYTIIYNDGDTYVTDDDNEPGTDTEPPSDDPVDPDPDDPLEPYDPTKPFPDTPDNPTPDPGVHGSPGSDGTITIPDFNFDIPDINWSLDGLQHKFPFSLPFDLYNACKLLNAEPQTPELDYTVNLVVYQWPIQMDLHWLDPAARVIRIFELLAFVVGLILITRHLIGG